MSALGQERTWVQVTPMPYAFGVNCLRCRRRGCLEQAIKVSASAIFARSRKQIRKKSAKEIKNKLNHAGPRCLDR